MFGSRSRHVEIEGHLSKGFEGVREAFAENFSRRNELGAACCVYRRGERVVDLWGGVRDKATGKQWEEDTSAGRFARIFIASTEGYVHSDQGPTIEDVAANWATINDETSYSVPSDLMDWSAAFMAHLRGAGTTDS